MSENVVQHPRAALGIEKIRRAERAAADRQGRADHRKYLKETKPKRDLQRAIYRRHRAAEAHISDVIWRAAEAMACRSSDRRERLTSFKKALFVIAKTVEAAAETSAASAAGYESWPSLLETVSR